MNEQMLAYLKEIGIETEVVRDEDLKDIDFSKPIRGKYKVVAKGRKVDGVEELPLKRNEGVSSDGNQYDNYKLTMQCIEDISGDASNNRFLDKVWWNGESEYNDDPLEGAKKLIQSLITMGIQLDFVNGDDPHQIILKNAAKVVGKEFFVRAYPNKNGKQTIIITTQPKEYGMPKEAPAQASGKAPF